MNTRLLLAFTLMLPFSGKAMLIDEPIPAAALTVSASSTFSPEQTAQHLIDGSGLSGDRHDAEGSARTMWHTVENPAPSRPAEGLPESPAWVRFDFNRPLRLSEIKIWNHNQAGLTDRGFRKAHMYASADGTAWDAEALEVPRAPGTPDAPCSLVVKAGGKAVKSVILAADSNYGSVCFGLSEVQFIVGRDVAEADLPFPSGMTAKVHPYYGHRADGKPGRAITLSLEGAPLYGDATIAALGETTRLTGLQGARRLTLLLPSGAGVTNACEVQITLRQGAHALPQTVSVPAKRQWTVMLFPHSHVDIGYTNPQDVVEKIHMRNLDVGIELGRSTAGYPDGARHVWNNEVLWAVESWLKQATPAKTQEFVDAVKQGWIGLSASYDNANTSTASDEELLHFFAYARALRTLTGAPIDTMCQFDVPGMGWGVVQAAAQCGVRAILAFPNPSDRIGDLRTLENRPFYWVAPDGKAEVLYLQCFPYNVAWKLGGFNLNPRPYVEAPGRDRIRFADTPLNGTGEFRFEPFLQEETAKLEAAGLPYDIFPCAWSLCDNAPVDVGLPDYVRHWNETYAYPKLVIASAHDIAAAFERKFAKLIPERRGDLTEYWTDGLGTDARRVGYNRIAKEALIQAETLWTMLRRHDAFPQAAFYDAWRWIQLGSEHTWGYMMPEQPIAKQIEATKAAYFEAAKQAAEQCCAQAVAPIAKRGSAVIAVLNTLSWNRSGLVVLSAADSRAGDGVSGSHGPVPSQRLSTGELVFLAGGVPALGSSVFHLHPGITAEEAWPHAKAEDTVVENALVKVTLNLQTGDIASLVDKRTGHEFVNPNSSYALNSYRYLRGGDAPGQATLPSAVKISSKEVGPVVAALVVESNAEGCRKLTREIRVIAGQPQVTILDTVDKISMRQKEGIHFAFAFNVSGGATRMDIPWGVMNPLTDQLPGANKNWLAFQRWIDVSNDKAGVTWVGIEPAIVQFGDITANLLGPVAHEAWLKQVGDTQTIISWALNNHWHTNFPLEQGGLIPFRYAILPHASYDPVVANRFGLEENRPLVAVPIEKDLVTKPPVAVDNPRVFVSTLTPSADGRATLLRLRSVSDQPERVTLSWPAGRPKSILRVLAGDAGGDAPAGGELALLPYGIATLRLEF